MDPAAGVGGSLPGVQGNRPDVVPLLLVEQLEEGTDIALAYLGRGSAEVDQEFGAVVKDGDSTQP